MSRWTRLRFAPLSVSSTSICSSPLLDSPYSVEHNSRRMTSTAQKVHSPMFIKPSELFQGKVGFHWKWVSSTVWTFMPFCFSLSFYFLCATPAGLFPNVNKFRGIDKSAWLRGKKTEKNRLVPRPLLAQEEFSPLARVFSPSLKIRVPNKLVLCCVTDRNTQG